MGIERCVGEQLIPGHSIEALSIVPDTAWFSSMASFRNLVGGVLAALLIMAVLALVVTSVGLAWSKIRPGSSVAVSADVLLRVLIGALVAACLSGMVAWSFTFNLNLTGFSGKGLPKARFVVENPHPNVSSPGFDPCAGTVGAMRNDCWGY